MSVPLDFIKETPLCVDSDKTDIIIGCDECTHQMGTFLAHRTSERPVVGFFKIAIDETLGRHHPIITNHFYGGSASSRRPLSPSNPYTLTRPYRP